jgi:hypothetical protein
MSAETNSPSVPKWMFWAGWVLSGVLSLLFAFSGVMKLTKSPDVVEGFTHLGWPDNLALAIGTVELACTILYLIPQTAVLGAILLTGYMGGAIATHVRLGEPFWLHVVIGVVLWLGLYFRDPRLRVLIPLRTVT